MKSTGTCIQCKCDVWITDALYEAAKAGAPHVTFYCGFGHPQVFAKGESQLDQMRRERDRLAQRVAEWSDEAKLERERREAAERRGAAARGRMARGLGEDRPELCRQGAT